MTTTQPLNHRVVNVLRHADAPVATDSLAALYEDAQHLHSDLGLLKGRRLVAETRHGLIWQGS